MRFVWAVAAFVLAALMIGAGIAQRTVLEGPSSRSESVSVDGDAPYLLVDSGVLTANPGTQTLAIEGDGTIFAAYGRTGDMRAWLSDVTYVSVSRAGDGAIVTETIEPEVVAATDQAAPAASDPAATPSPEATAASEAVRSPVGSDLWLDEFQRDDRLVAPLQLPDGMSVLVASDGTEPAPGELSVSWPIDNATPLAGPLIVGGAIVLAAGVLLYILGIRHARRSRGPRRKGLPMPPTQPIDLADEGAGKGVISASPTRRAVGSGRRAFAIVPAVAVSALLFTGCSADSWPQLGPSPTPSPTPTVVAPEGQQPPAVTEAQAQRILTRVAEATAAADEAKDATLAASRLTGAVLAERTTNYTLRTAIADYAPLAAVPDGPLELVLPQATEAWPRTLMTVVVSEADETVPPTIMLLVQDDPWAEYKLTYLASLEASTELPSLAPAYVGAAQVPPDSSFLVMAPDQLAAAYADVLNNGESSAFYDQFSAEDDLFRVGVANNRAERTATFNQTGAQTGTLSFTSQPGDHPPLALATIESGAIVAVTVNEIDTVRPNSSDAVIKLQDSPRIRALTQVDESATGFTTTFIDQLFFYVPGQGSSEQIRLLGYASNILNAKVNS